jgi:hypothetical protein
LSAFKNAGTGFGNWTQINIIRQSVAQLIPIHVSVISERNRFDILPNCDNLEADFFVYRTFIVCIQNSAPSATFYTVCSSKYFVGLVGLLNSLRLVGHTERVVVLDCGLNEEQKSLIRGHCELMVPPPERARNVAIFKAFMLQNDRTETEIAIMIDSDVIVTRRLDDKIAAARAGKICVFTDPESDRWFPDWATIFPMQAALRRETYATATLIVISTRHWPHLFDRWWAYCERLINEDSYQEGRPNQNPVAQIDQDALNALLMSEVPAGSVYRPSIHELVQSPFQRATVIDAETLECVYEHTRTSLLHWPGRSKPFMAWARFDAGNAQVVLLRRLLMAKDVAIKIPDHYLPLRLRSGGLGAATYAGARLIQRSLSVVRSFAKLFIIGTQY